MIFDRLHPTPGPVTAPELLGAVDWRGRAPEGRPRVLLNMVASVDGRATVGGSSLGMAGPGDRRMFAELRAIADGVLIGTRTLSSEPYGRLVRDPERRERRGAAGLAEDPRVVLLSRGLDLPWDAPLFAVPTQPVVVACSREAAEGFVVPATDAPVTLLPLADPTPGHLVRALPADLRVLLCEGGPTLNARLLDDDILDDLFLTVAPLLSGEGSGPGIVDGEHEAARLELEWVLRHDDELLLRYAIRSRP